MTVQERLEDIANESGYSKEVVHMVLKACMTSLVKSLRVGERATLPGICSFSPSVVSKIRTRETGPAVLSNQISIKANISKSLSTKLADLDDFEHGIDTELYKIPNVAAYQIEELV